MEEATIVHNGDLPVSSPTLMIAQDRDVVMSVEVDQEEEDLHSEQQQQQPHDIEFNPPVVIEINDTSSEHDMVIVPPSNGSFVRRSPHRNSMSPQRESLPGRSPSSVSERSVPYIGDVNEYDPATTNHDNNNGEWGKSSWVFPINALTNSIHSSIIDERSEDISFVPPPPDADVMDKDEEEYTPTDGDEAGVLVPADKVVNVVPRDGSFVGDPKLHITNKGVSAPIITRQQEDIPFVPPPNEGANNEADGNKDGSPLETGPDVSESVPRDGSFIMGRKSSQIDNSLSHDSWDIDFSPAGSAMETAASPRKGSYFEERHVSPKREPPSRFPEINVTPDTPAGKDMPGSPPPKPGSFIGQQLPATTRPSVQDFSKGQNQKSPPPPVDREINFTTGASAMKTGPPPLRGSYHETRHATSPMRDSSTHRHEINVLPDKTGVDMPTSPPPKRGSFFGDSSDGIVGEEILPTSPMAAPPIVADSPTLPQLIVTETREVNFSPGASEMETAAPPLRGSFIESRHSVPTIGTSSSHHEINVLPEIAGKDMPTSPPPKQGSFLGQTNNSMEDPSVRLTTGVEEPHILEKVATSDSEEEDPLADDQSLWRSKKAWEAARINQTTSSDAAEGEEENERQPSEFQLTGDGHATAKTVEASGETEAEPATETGEDDLDKEADSEEVIETVESDLLDDLLGDEEPIIDDGESSVSESIVELGPLKDFGTRSENKVHDDDETVHIGNTTKQRQEKMNEEMPDDFVPDDSIAKLEAMLDQALEAPLEESSGNPHGGPYNFIEHGSPSLKKNRLIPDDPTSESKALDTSNAIEGAVQNDEDEPYAPNESIAKLEAMLDEALESPLESLQQDTSDESTSGLDALLEEGLDDELEITFEPTDDETKALVEVDKVTSKPRPTSDPKPKSISSTSRLTRLTQSTRAKSKRPAAKPSPPKPPAPTSRKPAIPRFRGTKTTPRPTSEKEISKPPPKKAAIPQFHASKSKSDNKGSSFMSSTFSARKKPAATNGNEVKEDPPRASVARRSTKKIISKLTSWTKRGNEKTTEAPQDQSPASAAALTASLHRELPNGNIEPTIDHLLAQSKPIVETPSKQGDTFTGMPSILKHSDFYRLTPRSESIASLSSQCSVADFKSPRREGKRGCQKKFNPYLHDYRGPCELCVFFLSDEERARLDAEGRHVRVMFTAGGCCRTCEIFPRSFDEAPARLCRMCYGNSHRKIHDYFSGRQLI